VSDRAARGKLWDDYVDRWPPEVGSGSPDLEWPGDEWGNDTSWERMYGWLLAPAGVDAWERAVEIGPGSGKYTVKVLENPRVAIRGYDISPRFLEVCEKRCADWIEEGRLSLHLLEGKRPNELLADLTACGWRRSIDALYSIDVMVHVELEYLMAYLITAAAALKPGGRLILTVANAASDDGFDKVLGDIRNSYPLDRADQDAGRFAWLSPEIVESIIARTGFRIDQMMHGRGRYVVVIATLERPEVGDELEAFLASETQVR
jgi:SAM-dependent methyltransferase